MARVSINIDSMVGDITVNRDDHLGRLSSDNERAAIFEQLKSAIETVAGAYGIGMELVAFAGATTLRNPTREGVGNGD